MMRRCADEREKLALHRWVFLAQSDKKSVALRWTI